MACLPVWYVVFFKLENKMSHMLYQVHPVNNLFIKIINLTNLQRWLKSHNNKIKNPNHTTIKVYGTSTKYEI